MDSETKLTWNGGTKLNSLLPAYISIEVFLFGILGRYRNESKTPVAALVQAMGFGGPVEPEECKI